MSTQACDLPPLVLFFYYFWDNPLQVSLSTTGNTKCDKRIVLHNYASLSESKANQRGAQSTLRNAHQMNEWARKTEFFMRSESLCERSLRDSPSSHPSACLSFSRLHTQTLERLLISQFAQQFAPIPHFMQSLQETSVWEQGEKQRSSDKGERQRYKQWETMGWVNTVQSQIPMQRQTPSGSLRVSLSSCCLCEPEIYHRTL